MPREYGRYATFKQTQVANLQKIRHAIVKFNKFMGLLSGCRDSFVTSPKHSRNVRLKTQWAHFPYNKRLDQFDFQPSVNERKLRELARLTFV
jgi:hypothetical protein